MGYMTAKTVKELSYITEHVHSVNSDAHLTFEPETESVQETWFDRWVLNKLFKEE